MQVNQNGGFVYVTDYGNNIIRKVIVTGYTIDKQLPPGLTFDPTTGVITGTPTSLWPPTDYTVVAYNTKGSSSTVVNIQVVTIALNNQIIQFPALGEVNICKADFPAGASSSNSTIQLNYLSSNTSVATISAQGEIHVVGVGSTIITVSQPGNSLYNAAVPQSQTLTVTMPVVPAVSIAIIGTSSVICSGTSISVKAVVINGSNNIIYQWQVNGINAGTNNPVFTSGNLKNGDLIRCVINNSGAACSLNSQATSNTITAAIVSPSSLIPSVSVSPVTYSACIGVPLTYTASAINAGSNPTYQWKVNGSNAGTNSATFTSSTLVNNDKIVCTVTSSFPCSINATSTSNVASLITFPNISNSVSIVSNAINNFISPGDQVTFTATTAYQTSATTIVQYQWQVNGVNAGENEPVFTTSSLRNNDVVTCTIITTGRCIVDAFVYSNAITILTNTKVKIPNAFTPNGDGINDKWNISALAEYPKCSVSVFNRYGSLIFYNAAGYPKAWDGTYKGKHVPSGTYYFIIDLKNGEKPFAGPLTVLR